jgi:hypothetical protein
VKLAQGKTYFTLGNKINIVGIFSIFIQLGKYRYRSTRISTKMYRVAGLFMKTGAVKRRILLACLNKFLHVLQNRDFGEALSRGSAPKVI